MNFHLHFYSLITQHQKSSLGFTYSKLWRGPQDKHWNSTPTGLRSLPSTGFNAARWFHQIKVQFFILFFNLHSLVSSVEKWVAIRPQVDLLDSLQPLKMAKDELRHQLLFERKSCLQNQHMLVRYVLKHGGWFELVFSWSWTGYKLVMSWSCAGPKQLLLRYSSEQD